MTKPNLEFHPEAIAEARDAYLWYAERSESAATGFQDELDRAVAKILESPDRWANYLNGTKRYLMHRFPYVVVYRRFEDAVLVVAVAHGHRRPGYWRDRLS